MFAGLAAASLSRVVAACVALGTLSLAVFAEDPAAVEFLTKKGLTKRGTVWMCPEEVKVVDGLTNLKTLEKTYKDLAIKIDGGLKKNAAARTALTKARVEYEQLKQVLDTRGNALPINQYNQIVNEVNARANLINTYLPQVVDLDSPDENPAFKAIFKDLIVARDKLLLAVLGIRAHADKLEEYYGDIKADPDVTEAMKLLGPPHKLGPAKNYSKELKPLEMAEKLVLTDDTPVYRDDRILRISLIMNDEKPITLGYTDQAEYSLLGANAAKELGVAAKEGDPEVTLNGEGGKKYVGREITIPSLRIGKHVLKDVKMILMPPEADVEGMPTFLGTGTFAGLNFAILRDEFKFAIKPPAAGVNAAAPPKKKGK